MSIVSNFHNIELLTANSKALENQRLVSIHYKGKEITLASGEKQTVKFPSLCVSIPQLRLNLSGLAPAAQSVVISMFEDMQDKLIRTRIDERRSADNPSVSKKATISDDEISIESIVAFAAATGNGKLSSDGIKQWFDSVLAEPLLAFLINQDTERTDDQLAAISNNYSAALQKLAAVSPGLPAAAQQQLRKLVAMAPEDDQMAPRLIAKLDSMSKAAAISLDAL